MGGASEEERVSTKSTSRMTGEVLLVGSMPYATVDDLGVGSGRGDGRVDPSEPPPAPRDHASAGELRDR
jgi:hypothetical protein